MPEPLTYCPSVAYSMPEDPGPELVTTTRSDRITANGGSEGRGNAELEARGGTGPNAGRGASESKSDPPSCLAPALTVLSTCGAVVGTHGVAALVTGASCVVSWVKLDECLAQQRAAKK